MSTIRLLILSSDTAGGHRIPAEAIKQACSSPGNKISWEVKIIDILAEFGYPPAAGMLRFYPWVVNHIPWLWGGFFHIFNSPRRYHLIKRLGATQLRPGFEEFLRGYDPHVVLSVYPHLGEVVKKTLRRLKRTIPFITLITDLETMHASWFHPAVDRYIVCTETARINAVRYGIPGSRIHVLGLPVRREFRVVSPGERINLKKSLGLDPGLPVVFITGGWTGCGILPVVNEILRQKSRGVQVLVVCGRNKHLYSHLRKREGIPGLHVYSYVDNIARLFSVSDIIAAKAGANVIMEAIYTGVPLILTGFIPGQEKGNVSFVQRTKTGTCVKNPARVCEVIRWWLDHPGLLEEMRQNAARVVQKETAAHILDLVYKMSGSGSPRRDTLPGKGVSVHLKKRRRKLLLISSSPYKNDGSLIKRSRLWFPALTIPLLAGLAPPRWDTEIIYEMIEDIPWNTNADLIGINGIGLGLKRSLDIADQFRGRGKKVVLGGTMASLAPGETAGHCDSLVTGEAEGVLCQLLEDFEQGQLKPVYRAEKPALLRDTAIPRYDLLIKKKVGWWLPAQAGRGCPHRCEFCSVASIYHGRYRPRVISEIIRDIRVIKSLGYRRVFFVDDNIGADPDFALELFKEVAREKIEWISQCSLEVTTFPRLMNAMAESGCLALSFGLESINQNSLDNLNKTFLTSRDYEKAIREVRSYGIEVSVEMMMGIEGDHPDTFEETFTFLMKNRIALPRIFIITPIPGTPLYETLHTNGQIFEKNLLYYSGTKAVFHPAGMDASLLDQGYWRLNDRLFTLPNILKRILGPSRKLGLPHIIFLLVSNLSYRTSIKNRLCPGIV
jgi:UDP-N-acetylglucosamine:LPS N-acetylglucosamine transferase